ncbi:chorion protein b at 7F [Haematobia irritans]|uniref:chorion protein b at 7F n=1 Tax=Haematobia irritans TaxID=7368 RepID=UPI003F5000D2
MSAYCITVVLVILAMISAFHCVPIDVVYTGDSCACPKSLHYRVNVPPPPVEKENPRYEHGYKLEVPPPPKAKVIYNYDFTVQEPRIPPKAEEEKWNLYAKVDRITAHKKDCIRSDNGKTPSCGCGEKCNCSSCRYVSPIEAVINRHSQSHTNPNSLHKKQIQRFTTLIKTDKEQSIARENDEIVHMKNRHRRDLSSIFGLSRKSSHHEKRPERTIKQYHKSLPPREETTPMPPLLPKLSDNFISFTHFPKLQDVQRPLEKLHEMMFSTSLSSHSLRNKRDIKGEYDMLEKDREQMDLTLPEIIQYMPETLDPNFKRGRCQFSNCQQHNPDNHNHKDSRDSKQKKLELNEKTGRQTNSNEKSMDSKTSGGHHDSAGTKQIDDKNHKSSEGHSDNDIDATSSSMPLQKRNVGHYSCSDLKHFTSPPPPPEGYYIQSYDDQTPFSITGAVYGPDPWASEPYGADNGYLYPIAAPPSPSPPPSSSELLATDAGYQASAQPEHIPSTLTQELYGPEARYSVPPPPPQENYPIQSGYPPSMARTMNDDVHIIREPIRTPYIPPGYRGNPYLDQIIADIVSQHAAFTEASNHKGGALVDPLAVQDQETKSFLKLLAEGKFQKLFGDARPNYG